MKIKTLGFILFFLIIVSPFSYATDSVKVLFAGTLVFNDTIIFSVEIENKSEQNIYVLLDYKLQKIEYHENIRTIFATLSSEPTPLEHDAYYPTGFVMPNINAIAPGHKQLFHIIIRNHGYNIQKNEQIMRTAIDGLIYFISKPPNYDFWGSMVSYYTYGLYSSFYKNNVYLFDTLNLLGGF
jgi:hypothetical protein